MTTDEEVEAIRAASRVIVRELGFMRPGLAGTDLPPSAVHAIVEIGQGSIETASALSELLGLEKSSVSRMLDKLKARGLLVAETDDVDKRRKRLRLTDDGRALFAVLNERAHEMVRRALDPEAPPTRRSVREGLEAYAAALGRTNGREAPKASPEPEIEAGYRSTLLSRVTEMHARYYAREYGFGAVFERKVASEMSEFLGRLDDERNLTLSARFGDRIVGSISIDGEDLGDGKAHLRWFILDDEARGAGVGRTLMKRAMAHVDRIGFASTHLWTFRGLDAARRLYEEAGFVLAEEAPGRQWGTEVVEQRFVRRRP